MLVRSAGQIILGLWPEILREYERATSCNQAVLVTTRVQRNSELPLKMSPDHFLQVDSWGAVDACVIHRPREKTGQANSCYRYISGCATTHRREMRRQLELTVHNLVPLNTKMTLISGWLESYCLTLCEPQSFVRSAQNFKCLTVSFFFNVISCLI